LKLPNGKNKLAPSGAVRQLQNSLPRVEDPALAAMGEGKSTRPRSFSGESRKRIEGSCSPLTDPDVTQDYYVSPFLIELGHNLGLNFHLVANKGKGGMCFGKKHDHDPINTITFNDQNSDDQNLARCSGLTVFGIGTF
jgi:hypothetical protein